MKINQFILYALSLLMIASCDKSDVRNTQMPSIEPQPIATQKLTSPLYGNWGSDNLTYTYRNNGEYTLEYGTTKVNGYYHHQAFFDEYHLLLSCEISMTNIHTNNTQARSECTNRIVQITPSYYTNIYAHLAFTEYSGDCDTAIEKTKIQDMTVDLAGEVFMKCSYTQKFIDALKKIEHTFEHTGSQYYKK